MMNSTLPFDLFQASNALADAWLQCQQRVLNQVNLPLSGDVTQWIRTCAEAVAQVGLLNLNITGTHDPQTERRIGAQVSYGRQLGKIMDVLVPLVTSRPELFDTPQARGHYDGFLQLVGEIEQLKRRSAQAVIEDVQRWRDSPTRAQDIAALRAALAALDSPSTDSPLP